MQNLLNFLWNNQFTVLFILLEAAGFYLLGSQNTFHRSKIHQTSTAIAGELYDLQHSYNQYLGLVDENQQLREENAVLRQQSILRSRSELITIDGFQCRPAQAIKSTHHLESNFIIVNAGEVDGIQPASGVMSPTGVAGIVHTVSEHYASIMPLIHTDAKISGRLLGSEYFGQCQWGGWDPEQLQLENIPNHVQVQAGDTVVTRGGSGIFPPGLIIGFVTQSETDPGGGFQKITLQMATDFRKINTLYILSNDHKPELDSLLNETEEWIE